MKHRHTMSGKWVCHITDIGQSCPLLAAYVGQYLVGVRDCAVEYVIETGITGIGDE